MTMRDFLNMLFKRKWTLLFLFALFAGGMTMAAKYYPPVYHSVSSLYLRSKRETIDQSLVDNPTINRGIGLLLPDVLSEVELVRASEVRRLTIEKLGLESRKVKPSDPTLDKVAQRAAWDAYLYDNLLIEAAASANVINITVTDGDPKRAAEIAGAYADAYLDFRRRLATGGVNEVGLDSETKLASDKMLEAEAALTSFNEEWKLVDTAAQKTEMIGLHARTLAQVTDERAGLERAQADYRTYAKLLEDRSPEMREIAEIRANANCQSLETQISNDLIALAALLQHNQETTDSVVRMRQSLETLQKELDAKVLAIVQSVVLGKKVVVDQLAAGLAEHEKLLTDIRDRLALLVSKSGINDRLAVDLDLLRDHYKVVSRRQKQNTFDKVMGGTGNIDVLVANHGVAPNRPFFPPPFVLCVIVALLTGLVVAFSVVIVADVLDQSFKTPDEVERALATPVLGTIPKRPKHRLTALLGA
jgi:uncharacterized protein involved in exopolysaccharide biosynthesis